MIQKVKWYLPGAGGRKESYCLKGPELDFYNMKRILEMEGDSGCITMWMYIMPLNCVL